MSSWARHRPEAFGRAAVQLGREEPGLLQKVLGDNALMLAAAGLAAKFLGGRRRGLAVVPRRPLGTPRTPTAVR